jgi:hypothetical protein
VARFTQLLQHRVEIFFVVDVDSGDLKCGVLGSTSLLSVCEQVAEYVSRSRRRIRRADIGVMPANAASSERRNLAYGDAHQQAGCRRPAACRAGDAADPDPGRVEAKSSLPGTGSTLLCSLTGATETFSSSNG